VAPSCWIRIPAVERWMNQFAPSGRNAAGTAGNATAGTTYELTGSGEPQAATHVGKRVEITGKMKVPQTAGGGPTANVPLSRDLKLPEFEVTSVRETMGTCPATR
jgi:hypothetical protein